VTVVESLEGPLRVDYGSLARQPGLVVG